LALELPDAGRREFAYHARTPIMPTGSPRGASVRTLTIRLLGGLWLEYVDTVVELGPARVKALVAFLLVYRDRSHARAQIASLLWPESDEAQARTNLRQTLFHLRRALPEAEHFVRMDGQRLQWQGHGPLELDVARLDDAIARATHAREGDAGLERGILEEAVRLYRGDLLPEIFDPWLDDAREQLRERFALVLERLAILVETQRDYRSAVHYAQRLVVHDPLRESSHRRLMRLHALCGERSKALHAYHSCATVLQRELGVEPTHATHAMYEGLLLVDPADAASEGTGAGGAVEGIGTTVVPFVGRTDELAQLASAWSASGLGRPALVLVNGDSGVGKSRLVEEFALGLGRRETSIATRCYPAEGALAFAPVTDLLRHPAFALPLSELDGVWRDEVRRLLPELSDDRSAAPGPLTEGWQRTRLFEALARAVLAVQPLLVVVDDLQWCDRDSIEWLHFLLRFDPVAQLLVVATARTHDLGANDAVLALLKALHRDELVMELELAPLSAEETAVLARSLRRQEPGAEALAGLFAETEGNPLFVIEMLRAGTEMGADTSTQERPLRVLPPKLRAVIASRLERLASGSFELMCMAAVIGRDFGFELLVKVSRRTEDDVARSLDELWQRRVVREASAGRYDFSHGKLREVAYEQLSLTRRRLLHRHTAEALEALDPPDRDGASGQIAYHYDRAGLPTRAIVHYQAAAEAAQALFAHEDAITQYRRALKLVEDLPLVDALATWRQRETARVLEGLGDVFALKGVHDAASEYFERATDDLPADDVGRARLLRKVAAMRVAQYRYDEALVACEAAEIALGAEAAADDAAWWREWIEIGLARGSLHYWAHQWPEIERILTRVEPAVMQHGTALQRGKFFSSLADMFFQRDGYTYGRG
jgi:DNA-binding SARP family transcriptional activator/tetratricopeptide (TPR) repeat protein